MVRINVRKTKRKVYRTNKVRRNTLKRTHMKRKTMKRKTMKRIMKRKTMKRRMKRSNKYKSKYGGSTATISSTYKQEINNHMSKLERIDVEPASFVRISTGAEMHNNSDIRNTIVIPDIINNDGFRKKQTYKVFFMFSNEQIVNPYVISKTYRDFDELREKILEHVKTNESEKLDTYKILFAEKLGIRSDYWSNKHTKDYKESSISKRGLKRSIKLTNFLRLMLHGPELLMESTNMSAEDNNKIRGLNISHEVKAILYNFLGNTMFDDIKAVINSTPKKIIGCPQGKKKIIFPFHDYANCADKSWANCISDKFNKDEGAKFINDYLLQEGEINGENNILNIDEILRNMKRLLVNGIFKEIDENDAEAVTIPDIKGDVLDVNSIQTLLYKEFLKDNNDIDILKRILSSIDTTKSSANFEFSQMINKIVTGSPTPNIGEFGCVVKNMNNILITFCYYYVKLDCNEIDMGHGVKHGRFIVRAYNKYDLNNETWNTFKIQILPLNVGDTPMINNIILRDRLFRDKVIINMNKK